MSSSSEDEGDSKPRVTRLDAPTKVTFGGGSVSATTAATPSQAPSTKPPPTSTTPTSWTDHGGLLKTKGEERNLYWSQDRHSVTLRLELAAAEKIKSVTVDGILPYADRWSAVGTTKPKLVVCRSSDLLLLEGELPHPVHLEEDSDDGIVDWSIEDGVLCIILHKAVPMQGLSVWWRRPLMEFPEADLGEVRGEGGASKDFLAAWEEAHKIFREGKQKQKP